MKKNFSGLLVGCLLALAGCNKSQDTAAPAPPSTVPNLPLQVRQSADSMMKQGLESLPNSNGLPSIPGAPNMPVLPNIPGAPNIPGLPNIPGGPSAPATSSASDLQFSGPFNGGPNVAVTQNAEQDLTIMVSRGDTGSNPPDSVVFLVLRGEFQGDVKLAAEVVQGGKGLSVTFDPETVKGSDDTSKLRIKAAEDADLGKVDVRLTATTPDGHTTREPFPLTIRVEKKK